MMKNIKTKAKLLLFPVVFIVIVIISGMVYSYYSNYANARANVAIQTEEFIQELLKGRISVYQFLRTPTYENKQKTVEIFQSLYKNVEDLKAKLAVQKNIDLSNAIMNSSKQYIQNFEIVASMIIANQKVVLEKRRKR